MTGQSDAPDQPRADDSTADADHDDRARRRADATASSERTPEHAGTSDDGAGPDPSDPRIGEGLLEVDMGPSSALAHLYRGEIHRMKFWRERLDRTTNWAVILMAAILTWAFSSGRNPHYVILIGNVAVAVFLVIEARRYRAYDIWRSRVRTLQQHVWAPGLDPSRAVTNETWRADLADDYDQPTLKISVEEALAHRLRRVYLPMFAILNGAWLLRVTSFAGAAWPESAAVGVVPGTAVTALVALFVLATTALACWPRTWHADDELRTEALRANEK